MPLGLFALIAPRSVSADDPHARLMMDFRAGDKNALSELFTQYRLPLRSFFHKRLADKQLADDAVQDVFIRIIRYSKNYQPAAKFSTWLFTIAANIARDRLRAHNRMRAMLADQGVDFELPHESQSDRKIESREEFDRLRMRVDALPKRQRQAFELYYVDEKPYCEIADALNSTSMAIKGLLARGRKTLRNQLAN